MSLWGRRYKISVVDEKSGNGWDVSTLRCVFGVEKQLNQVAKLSILHIFNLSPETESAVIKEANRVIIEAGYDAETSVDANGKTTVKEVCYGKIYDGNIIQIIRTKDNNLDYDLSLVCLDGEDFLNQGHISISLAPQSGPREVIKAVTEKCNHPVEVSKISSSLEEKRLPRGKVIFGQPRDYLRDISYENNGVFWVEDNKVNLVKMTDPVEDEAIILTPQTGLIGYPTQTNEGVQIRCLLNPRIKLQGLVKIDNSAVRLFKVSIGSVFTPLDKDGEYQVIKLSHIGDTRGNDWYTDMIAVNREGLGAIPMLLENPKQSPSGGGG